MKTTTIKLASLLEIKASQQNNTISKQRKLRQYNR